MTVDSALPDSLSEGWSSPSFMDIFDIQGGTQPPKSTFAYEPQQGFVRLLQIRDFGDKPVPTFIPDTSNLRKCREDDVLIGRYGASVGRICTGMQGAYNVALAKVVVPASIDSRCVYYLLRSPAFQNPILGVERSAQNGFNKGDLEKIVLPIPPLAEQKRIVAKVEALLGRVNAARERLKKAPAILKRFRQSVLAAAFTGKLTEEWRDERRGGRCSTNSTAKLAPDKSCRNESISIPNLPLIPDSWNWTTVGSFADEIVGGCCTKKTDYVSSGVLVLNKGNIKPYGRISFSDDRKYVRPEYQASNESKVVCFGDVIVTLRDLSNKADFLGLVGQYREDCQAVLSQGAYLVKLSGLLRPWYLIYYSNSPLYREIVKSNKTGSTQVHLRNGQFRAIPIPWTSTEEQREIVRRVEALFSLAGAIEKRVEAATKRAEKLTQAILAKAFRGELVPTEAELARKDGREYEPASVLLERIRAERERAEAEKKTSHKGKKKEERPSRAR